MDAGASAVTVEIKNGGITFLKISDNGSGMEEDDAEIAFERHSTSKIRSAFDLDSIKTLGFRGEALASIAAVSSVELTTRTAASNSGKYILIQGGRLKEVKQAGCPVGTTFIIKDLFFNTPARFKFLKKDTTEAGYIADVIARLALGSPNVSFRFINNGSVSIHTPGNNDLRSAVFCIYGKDTAGSVSEINHDDGKLKISGLAGKPEIARASRNQQSVYLNGRYIRSKVITSAFDEAYKTYLMKNKFPFIILKIELNPLLVDVNVHPTKMEVRFSDEQMIFRTVYNAVTDALMRTPSARSVQFAGNVQDDFRFKNSDPKPDYVQQNISAAKTIVSESPSFQYSSPKPEVEALTYEATAKKNGSAVNVIRQDVLDKFQPKTDAKEKPGNKEITDIKIEEMTRSKDCKFSTSEDNIKKEEDIPSVSKEALIKETSNKENNLFNEDYRIIGQAFSTYILLQQNDEMVLLDQHAAHERIKYEYFKGKYKNSEVSPQMLIEPLVIELTSQETALVNENQDFFSRLGFIFEEFGNNSIILRSVPDINDSTTIKETFLQVADHLLNTAGREYRIIEDDALYTVACKAAVKANKRLDEQEIRNLIKELSSLENPLTCPHGRPTVIKISRGELERKFKRVL